MPLWRPQKQMNADPPCITTASAAALSWDAPRHLGSSMSKWFELVKVLVSTAVFLFLTLWTNFESQVATCSPYVKKGWKAEGAKAITVGLEPSKKYLQRQIPWRASEEKRLAGTGPCTGHLSLYKWQPRREASRAQQPQHLARMLGGCLLSSATPAQAQDLGSSKCSFIPDLRWEWDKTCKMWMK